MNPMNYINKRWTDRAYRIKPEAIPVIRKFRRIISATYALNAAAVAVVFFLIISGWL
ncbi:MAG: hypothetical protein M1149_06105 [Candidatus Thermoplasmatota archaeon]|jgi:hypothetical protein|nr:hypothetical protein [Candidatus Thermoplasmatota archaeon]